MSRRWAMWFYMTASVMMALPLSGTPLATEQTMQMTRIKQAIQEVQADVPSSMSRTYAAERLESLTRKVNPKSVDDETLSDMVSLLGPPDDSVRAFVAMALGHLGPRAKVAIPTLLKILPEVDCDQNGLTSAPAIRLAIKRMGQKPPPPPKCDD